MDKLNKKIQASSHSGATLTLVDQNDKFVVTKRIFENLDRALISTEKQIKFCEINTNAYLICSIPISNVFKCNDYLEIIMPFIDGIGGDVLTYKGNKNVADSLKVTLNNYLLSILSNSDEKVINGNLFLNKIENIKKSYCGNSKIVFEAIDKVISLSKQKLVFPMGYCHGDLTLSNMKVTQDSKLYLFDFLDGFLETPLQDIVKIKQDFDYGWSFRYEKKNLALKGKMFCEAAYPSMINTISRLYKNEIEILNLINLLRISPYIKNDDKITKDWLDKALIESFKN